MVGREPDVGVRFNDNDRDNIEEVGNDTEEQRKDEYVGGGVQQLEDDFPCANHGVCLHGDARSPFVPDFDIILVTSNPTSRWA